jgi:tetratricopeptide (TPR) repeat protein
MRGLRNLALVLNQAKRYDEALLACDQLIEECYDDVTAAAHRAAVYLNTGQWKLALGAAQHIHQLSPSESAVAAFAAFELNRLDDARALFLHAMLNVPRAVGMLVGKGPGCPKSAEEVDAHRTGVSLLLALADYLQKQRLAARRFFNDLWQDERMAKYRKELEDVTRRWREGRAGKDRSAFERMSTLRSWEFAKAECLPAPVVYRRESSRRVIH